MMYARRQAVMAELERAGWPTTTIGSPFGGLVIDPQDFPELIRISKSLRLHPPIEWNVQR